MDTWTVFHEAIVRTHLVLTDQINQESCDEFNIELRWGKKICEQGSAVETLYKVGIQKDEWNTRRQYENNS